MASRLRELALATLTLLFAPFAVSGCATTTPDVAAAPVSGIYRENRVTRTAIVQKIDLAKRLVTLKGVESGNTIVVKADESVKNLPQVKVGDQVTTTYYESVAYEVHKPGDAEVGVKSASGMASAEPGEKPAGLAADVVQVTATIVAIDKATPSVTLRRPDGEVVAVRVKDPTKLDRVAVGDLVEITYTQAVAIVVEPATAAK
jgi:Cu/Ag efflux protein CusF